MLKPLNPILNTPLYSTGTPQYLRMVVCVNLGKMVMSLGIITMYVLCPLGIAVTLSVLSLYVGCGYRLCACCILLWWCCGPGHTCHRVGRLEDQWYRHGEHPLWLVQDCTLSWS